MLNFFILLAIGTFLLLIYMYIEAHRNRVREHVLEFSNYPNAMEPIHIFFISDIHKRRISQTIIEKAKNRADFVIIGGDLLEKGVPLKRISKNIDKLNEIGPIYFIWGNNDYEMSVDLLKQLFAQKGVTELVNRSIILKENDYGEITLIGVDDLSLKRTSLSKAFQNVNKDSFSILASHDPRIVKKFTNDIRVDVIISGHTHGGQIRFLGFGLYEKGRLEKIFETTRLVSNGYGTTGFPLRLGAPAETHLITIKRAIM